jgi:hypothetical protein
MRALTGNGSRVRALAHSTLLAALTSALRSSLHSSNNRATASWPFCAERMRPVHPSCQDESKSRSVRGGAPKNQHKTCECVRLTHTHGVRGTNSIKQVAYLYPLNSRKLVCIRVCKGGGGYERDGAPGTVQPHPARQPSHAGACGSSWHLVRRVDVGLVLHQQPHNP